MTPISPYLWYEIHPQTTPLKLRATESAVPQGRRPQPELSKKEEIIQLVEEGEAEPNPAPKPAEKPVNNRAPARPAPLNAYQKTIQSHAAWLAPASRTVKIA